MKRLGADSHINRGHFDRYQTESVLKASKKVNSIDKEMARVMNQERNELFGGDMIMVPSVITTTGW